MQFYTMNPDGRGRRQLTYDTKQRSLPAWSPDGRQITFASSDGTTLEVYSMNADGTTVSRLTTWPDFCRKRSACIENYDLVWSPDGRVIAFEADRAGTTDGTYAIYTMNLDGSSIQRVTPSDLSVSSPTWAPDGKRIAFVAYESEDITAIDSINRNGSDLQTLIRGTNYLASPLWSK
jgi:Tol biopolymer transport system component